MSLTLIGISGKLTSGKTTLSDAIIEKYPIFVRRGFADALKDDIAQLCNVSREYLDEHKGDFRELLQHYGMRMRELHGDDYWVHRLEDDLWAAGVTHIIVDDVRFPNELDGVKRMGRAVTVRLVITEEEQEKRCTAKFGAPLTYAKLHHPSETALDGQLGAFDHPLPANIPTATQVYMVEAMLREKGIWL